LGDALTAKGQLVVYDILPLGSLWLIYLFAAVYLLAVTGLGLLISAYVNTQQQAMLIAFFLMMIFILVGAYTLLSKVCLTGHR